MFGGDNNDHRWKQELKAWQTATSMEKKKQAVTITLSFPEGSEVRSKVFEELDIEQLADEEGVRL